MTNLLIATAITRSAGRGLVGGHGRVYYYISIILLHCVFLLLHKYSRLCRLFPNKTYNINKIYTDGKKYRCLENESRTHVL